MYWMLLPMDPHQKMHLETRQLPRTGGPGGVFHKLWSIVRHLLGLMRR